MNLPDFNCSGWCVLENVVSVAQLRALDAALEAPSPAIESAHRRSGETFALRNALELPAVAALCSTPELRALIAPVLGAGAFAVRAIVFDKTPNANWKVPWHQDLSIAVREKRDALDFGPWSQKANAIHVQPPREVLESMLTTRLHLDACDARNGPLRVLSGSHLEGKLDAAQIAAWRKREVVEVHVPRGGALLMRPMLLHASSTSREPERSRRVLHIEWANAELPDGLKWRERV